MKYSIDRSQDTPAYLQLYRLLREDIVSGIYPYSSKLPSKRTLSEELGISTVTVEHSLSLLQDEGYIESRERSGYFVIFKKDSGFLSVGAGEHTRRIETSSSVTDKSFPFSVLAKRMRAVLSDYGEAILQKSENQGSGIIRGAISEYLRRSRGIAAPPENIVIGSGSEHLYSLAVELFGRDRAYAIESPSYKKIEEVYLASGAELERLPLGKDGILSEALAATCARVLHISPYRSYPSGVSASASKRHEYIGWASSRGAYIIEDDFESEFSVSKKPEDTLYSIDTEGRVIYMNSFSKTIFPGVRAAYMVLPDNLAKVYRERLGFLSCTVPTFEQLLIAELISGGDFERHVNRERRRKRRENGL